jgi:hypothetical protein
MCLKVNDKGNLSEIYQILLIYNDFLPKIGLQ